MLSFEATPTAGRYRVLQNGQALGEVQRHRRGHRQFWKAEDWKVPFPTRQAAGEFLAGTAEFLSRGEVA